MCDKADWEGAIDTPDARANHRSVGPHRAWSHHSGEWCYPSDPCHWCRETRGDVQVWIPAQGTEAYKELVERLASREYPVLRAYFTIGHTAADAVLSELIKEES